MNPGDVSAPYYFQYPADGFVLQIKIFDSLVSHDTNYWKGNVMNFINTAKDTPQSFSAEMRNGLVARVKYYLISGYELRIEIGTITSAVASLP